MSTAAYPQSNGLAESAVKTLKALVKKHGNKASSEEFHEGFLELCNTPRTGGKSPAEIVFGHPLRSRVPAHHKSFDPQWLVPLDEHDRKTAEIAAKAAERYDASSKSLPPLQVGTEVLIQTPQSKLWDRTGKIISIGRSRDYQIRLPSGRCLWRNRRFLRPLPAEPKPQESKHNEPKPQPPKSQNDQPAPNRRQNQTKPDNNQPIRSSKRVRFKPDRLNL